MTRGYSGGEDELEMKICRDRENASQFSLFVAGFCTAGAVSALLHNDILFFVTDSLFALINLYLWRFNRSKCY